MLSPLTLKSAVPHEASPPRHVDSTPPSESSPSNTPTPTAPSSISLPHSLLDLLLTIPYLFIGVTVGLAGYVVSVAAIVFRLQPSQRDSNDANDPRYRRRPPLPARRISRRPFQTSPSSSPFPSPKLEPATSPSASWLSKNQLSASAGTSFRPRPRRQSMKSNRSWQAHELERVSEDEGECCAGVPLGRRGTWAGPETSSSSSLPGGDSGVSFSTDARRKEREIELPGLVLDCGSSEASSEVDTIPDAATLDARYRGLGGPEEAQISSDEDQLTPIRTREDKQKKKKNRSSWEWSTIPDAPSTSITLAKPSRRRSLFHPFRSPSTTPLNTPLGSVSSLALSASSSSSSFFSSVPEEHER
ncbi:hypothetical protein P7C70_g1299, partial [Phenoliferia sp. Uapishka_3]